MVLIDFDHGTGDVELPVRLQGLPTAPIAIGERARIDYGAAILRGVTVGAGAHVGPRSVVVRDVAPDAEVQGIPAHAPKGPRRQPTGSGAAGLTRETSTSPARIAPTPASCSADGASAKISAPSSTEPIGWIVSSSEVCAAGRRGSDELISSQPTTCEVIGEHQEPAVRGPGGHEVGVADDQPGDDAGDGRHGGRVEQRAGGPAQVGAAGAQQQDEAGVGQPGRRAEDHALRGVVAVGALLQRARDQHDAAQHERQRGEHAPAGALA